MISDSTLAYFQEAGDGQPGIRDAVRYNFRKSTPDHDCADVIICYYDGHHYYPVAGCFVTVHGDYFDAEFSSQQDPLRHPKSNRQYFDVRRGMELIRQYIRTYFVDVKKQF